MILDGKMKLDNIVKWNAFFAVINLSFGIILSSPVNIVIGCLNTFVVIYEIIQTSYLYGKNRE